MSNGINEISPDLRDWLLGRNLILSDTIESNGLQGLASGLGQIASTDTPPNSVQQSNNISEKGNEFRDSILSYNPYKSENNNQEINITSTNNGVIGNLPPGTSPMEYPNAVGSTYKDSKFTIESDKAREEMLKNKYYDADELYKVNINTVSIPSESNGIYKFRSSLLNRGVDFLANSVGLGSVSQTLGTISDNNDREMGRVANTELLKHFGYNAAFNTSRNTLGNINLNPLNSISGGDILSSDFTITVPKGGKAGDYMGKVLGTELPIDKTGDENSIFTEENAVTNTVRLNSQVENLGKGQVETLKQQLKQNKKFKPTVGKEGDDDTLQGELYAFGDGKGGIENLLNGGPENDEDNNEDIPKEEEFERLHGRITSQIKDVTIKGFEDSPNEEINFEETKTKHHWTDEKYNKNGNDGFSDKFNTKKTLLQKTDALFKSGKMRTLTTGKGVKSKGVNTEVETSINEGYISKGSGVMKGDILLSDDEKGPSSADDIFCRTWTTLDKYDKISSLQKNSGLKTNSRSRTRRNVENSVLDNNGFVRIGPETGDGDKVDDISETKIKRFMFSLENLAWSDSDSLAFLPECEIGPGDPMTGTRGRIMWFPPYNIEFTDNSTVNWDSTDFIGRGEPVYTYNNTEREGTLSWDIIIDHASYMNDLKGVKEATNDVFASMTSGCLDINAKLRDKISQADQDEIEKLEARETPEIEDTYSEPPEGFSVYFPNDNKNVLDGYEDGSGSGIGDYVADPGYITEAAWGSNYKLRKYQDTTNFGLNTKWRSGYTLEVAEKIVKEAPYTRIKIHGYATSDGNDVDKSANERLSQDRANVVANNIRSKLEQSDDPIYDKRIIHVKGEGPIKTKDTIYDTSDGKYTLGAKCVKHCVDSKNKKLNRSVRVELVYDATLKEEVEKAKKPVEKNEDINISDDVKKKFFTECMYFDKLEGEGEDGKFIIKAISEKIKYFHPSYHSITPEGFNSRLTFLKQCTRQGPTLGREGSPNNLAFGKPPVCILRIGDFYHTKIAVNNVNLSFDPVTWDINPEGVGVQPMICNVNMNFKIIGGSSLQGPINRLQNAVSFNYYANTEIYDNRASYYKKSGGGDSESEDKPFKLVNGVNPNNFDTLEEGVKMRKSLKSGVNNNKEPESDEIERSNNINNN